MLGIFLILQQPWPVNRVENFPTIPKKGDTSRITFGEARPGVAKKVEGWYC
jgi:hypothetical protein